MPLPDCSIKVNGAGLPPTALDDLYAVTVQEDLEAPSMFTLALFNWDQARLAYTWSEERLFSPGNEVEIGLGYLDNIKKVMRAEITSLEPAFQPDETPTLTVRGYDHRHRLLRGTKTRSFLKMKDSAIAKQIASAAGLMSQVTDSGVDHDYVLQNNQTDLDFLQDRAARIGYDVLVRDKTLYFKPPQHGTRATTRLVIGEHIIEFLPRLTTRSQIGEVMVRGWDIKTKQAVVGKAGIGQEGGLMGGRASGPKVANRAFGKASLISVDRAIAIRAAADKQAQGQFMEGALRYISGEVVCQGNADLHAATVVEIDGAGRTFSGAYFVTSVTHTFTAEAGYRTTLAVRRNAS